MKQRAPLSPFAERNMPTDPVAVRLGVGAALCLIFFVAIISGDFVPGDGDLLVSIPFAVAAPIIGLRALSYSKKERRMKAQVYDQNDLDYEASKAIQAALPSLVSEMQRPTLNIDTTQSGVSAYQGLQLGEVSRHFDSQTSASIEGWLDHNFQVSARAASYQFSRGLGEHYRVGMSGGDHSARITGQSSVHLTFTGTTRANLLADSFVAVLEQETTEGWIDTLRVIVPAEPAIREYVHEYVGQFISSMAEAFGSDSHQGASLIQGVRTLAQSVTIDVSYVSDRLSAILRMPPEKRPAIAVVGTQVTAHAIVGGAVQFGNDGRWYHLFPISSIQSMTTLVERSASKVALPS